MAQVNLLGQPYAGKAAIASAQQAINVYGESNKEAVQAPAPITYYQFPGTELYSQPLNPGISRCNYRTSIGTAYTVVGPTVYLQQNNGNLVFVGSIPDRASQVHMADNGLAVVIVDGSSMGWAIDMVTNNFGPIIDPSFYGADQTLFLNTFFVFNRPGTNQFYISLGMVTFALLTTGTSFDPLDIAAKSGSADPIVAIATVNNNLWLIGALTTEPWIGTGAADFFFQQVQGAYVNHGCIAPNSNASTDTVIYWLMQDKAGKNIIVKTNGYDVEEVSTPYLVSQFNKYATTDDAIAFIFQIEDHAFYVLQFPTANITWAMELKTGYWAQWGKWNTLTNQFDRIRFNNMMFFDGKLIGGDFATGKNYKLNPDIATDDGDIMKFVRTFLHMIGQNYERVIYKNCSVRMQPGTSTLAVGDPSNDNEPEVLLSWSDDGGVNFGFPVPQSLGRQGETLVDTQWNRLGWGRDRIFKIEWNGPVITALNGAYVEVQDLRS